MKNIFEVLRHKELQLRQLQQEVDALRTAARLLEDEKDRLEPSGKLSQTEMIKAVLKAHGSPMHVKDISREVAQRFKKDVKPSYVAPVIHRMLGKWFVKADQPNTFGLTEWPLNQASQMPLENGKNANA